VKLARFRRSAPLALAAALMVATALVAQEIPSAPDRWLTDAAGFLSASARESLDRRLQEFERESGIQFIVYIDRTTGDVPLEDWAVRAFEQWRIGRQGTDNGVILFIMAEDRKIRIEVGYGLEGQLPDALAGRIINETIVPEIQAGRPDDAVTRGVEQITTVISGGTLPDSSERPQFSARKKLTPGRLILFIIAGIGFLILFITNPSLALYLLFSILSGGRGGGGGGGFRGGGGRSGGGGASGSW